jgi:membrane protease YdiL (CAAX protease family)
LLTVLFVLLIIRVSGERWSTYGFKPRNLPLDLITGCLALACAVAVALIGGDLFQSVLTDLNDKPYVNPSVLRDWFEPPKNASGLFAMLTLAIVIGLSEEIIWRGYLIPTLERLLNSTLLSVLVAAAYFGACHWADGALSVWSAFLVGTVFGIFFVVTRRIWPLMFAHALIDFSVFIRI